MSNRPAKWGSLLQVAVSKTLRRSAVPCSRTRYRRSVSDTALVLFSHDSFLRVADVSPVRGFVGRHIYAGFRPINPSSCLPAQNGLPPITVQISFSCEDRRRSQTKLVKMRFSAISDCCESFSAYKKRLSRFAVRVGCPQIVGFAEFQARRWSIN